MSQPEVTLARGPEPEDLVQSVSRALRVLEVVTTSPGLPVKAIARRSGLNLSTTYHLVRTLAYEGYVRRLPDGCYDVGTELPRRFHDVVESLGRPPQSRDVLSHLVQATGLSAYLGRLSASGMVVAEVVEGPGSPYLEDFEVGLEVAAHATALGKALLAAMPRATRREYLRSQGGLPAFTAQTMTDAEALEGWLRSVDTAGPVVEHGEYRDGVSCAAALVPQTVSVPQLSRGGAAAGSPVPPAEGPVWAVVVSTRTDELSPQVGAELMRAARDLAHA
ncbi:IclR family transcriptional regulator C-terminal domain-containing protein [Knoellia sp. 3-2P3]|uniref:IclR family transcriptional regulator n=1 Tax=unclassified Knoellia TaxID=2618719 RepID=UPI0023DBD74C|nr:IclR family transcriptional regulator C-terminal domain-containing protein [Knoellia sp. 3-2P3]MDF2092560.1 IclR family transcriptional regulator C-terminal domain-containing protein [Knoellia sp. 3-2P3]